jgi:hypothetical protein
LTFKDQFVTGGEMWSFRCAILGQCVYTQKKLAIGTLRVRFCSLSPLLSSMMRLCMMVEILLHGI